MPDATQVVRADLTWHQGRVARGVAVRVNGMGRIEAVGDLPDPPTHRLEGRLLLPGFVNAHSHAFQRGLRGRGETFLQGAGDFWSWREAMYDLVAGMDQQALYRWSRLAFEEMLAAGITTVGEFHYLHHDDGGEDFALDEVVLRAAADAGIRIALLNACYVQGGFDTPLLGAQARFATPSPEAYWRQMDRLAERLDPATQTLGAVAHSVRAVPLDQIVALRAEAERRHLVFHMHVEEQPREIEECLRATGRTPLALLNEVLDITPSFTAVHLTHSAVADLDDFLDQGGNACLCPLTEANLGDGIAAVPEMHRRGAGICLGTDSNARISMLEEARWLEYVQRLARQRRGVCVDEAGAVAGPLVKAATIDGGRALGLRVGDIRPGFAADFVTADLEAPALQGCAADDLPAALLLGADERALAEVAVAGRWRSLRREPAGAVAGP